MATHAAPAPTKGLTFRGYPVLLPKLSDPRLHLAAVITSLQVFGQAAFDFRLSIAQILISLGTCAVLEVGITFAQKRVLMWPASALLTGNGVAFILWLAFAAGIGVLALTDHAMTARWHLGPIHGAYFWWVLLTSPEVLVFLFFMLTDPRTAPRGRGPRAAYAVAVGLLAAALTAPLRTEYATKVALLGALAVVCVLQPLARRVPLRVPPRRLALAGGLGLAVYAAALAVAGVPAHMSSSAAAPLQSGALPALDILPSRGVQGKLDIATARRIEHALVTRVPATKHDRVRVWLVAGTGQDAPRAKAQLA